jgi:hypothetical protein
MDFQEQNKQSSGKHIYTSLEPIQKKSHRKTIIIVLVLCMGALLFLLKKTGVFGITHVSPPETFSIFYTCDTTGHIEPCGCSSGMAGGISRRQTYFAQTLPRNYLIVDAGNVTAGNRPWEILELEYILKGYDKMGYHAVNIGQREILLGFDALKKIKGQYSRFVSANVYGPDGQLVFNPYIVTKLSNGYRCGIIGIVDDDVTADEIGEGLKLAPPIDALSKYLPDLKKKSDYIVLLAFAEQEKLKAIARHFFEINIIVGGKVQQASSYPLLENKSAIVFNTDKGKNVGKLDIRLASENRRRYDNDIFVIEEAMKKDEVIAALVEEYKAQLKEREFHPLKNDEEGISSISAVRSKNADKYIGPQSCKECHEKSYKTWSESKHAKAFDALEAQNNQYNPKCLPCHSVGYMASDGYFNEKITPQLKNVSCESCHGRGDYHVKLENNEKITIEQLKMKQTKCITCHDKENSPAFDETKYLEKITHGKNDSKVKAK